MVHTEFWGGNLKEREHLREPDVVGRIILKWTQEVGWRHELD
jgi:hypothetical protein